MKSRRMHLALALTLSGGLLLSACADGGSSAPQGEQATPGGGGGVENIVANNPQPRENLQQGGTFTLPMEAFPTNFNNNHVDGNLAAWNEVLAATDPNFFVYSPDGQITPRTEYLTEMPAVADEGGKQVITYKLNPQAVWNDGTKIDWKSFDATWKALKDPVDKGGYNNVANAGFEDIESVEQGADENQVKVTMARPFYPVTNMFSGVIHPKLGESSEAFNTLMKDDVHAELRSGPFTFESIDKTTQTVVLKPNEKWWGNKPMLDQVVFRQMEDSADIPAFRNGEVDRVVAQTKPRLDQVQGTTGADVRRSVRLVTRVFVFNTAADSLKDINVRKAIWQGLDVEALKQVQYSGMDYSEDPVGSYLFFNFQPEAENNMPVQFDQAAAEQTLQQAGYAKGDDGIYAKDGQKLTVRYTAFGDDPTVTALAQTIQNQLKAIGIDLQLDIRASAQFGETMEKKTFDFLGMAWGSTSPSPVTGLCQIMCSDSSSNYAGVGTPELDQRMKAVGQIADAQQQATEMNGIEKEWLQQYGQMPWTNGPAVHVFRQGLANYGPAGFASVFPKWEDVGWQQN